MDRLTFGTDGWRDVIADRYTFANLRRAAQAYAEHLRSAPARKASPQEHAPQVDAVRPSPPREADLVLVGYDTRFMAAEFAGVVARVLVDNGLRAAISQTYLPTPALSFAVKRLGAVGGVMLTASHNPPHYGGFKLKGAYGGTATDDIYRAVAGLVPDTDVPEATRQDVATFDIRDEYYRAVAALVDMEAIRRARPTIVHDAMGGAGSGWLAGVAHATGAFEVEPLRARPDPLFHGVNPEPIAANLAVTRERMARVVAGSGWAGDSRATGGLGATGGSDAAAGGSGAAGGPGGVPLFAVATDGDSDRIGVVLPGGAYFDSHQVFAVLLDHLASRRRGTVVKTFTVSRVIERLAAARGLPVLETPVGFKHVVDAMLAGEGEGVLIGGEESGGIGVSGHIPERDAIANALILLEAVVTGGVSLGERFAAIERETGWRHAYDRLDLHLRADGTKERVLARLGTGDVGRLAGGWRVTSVEDRDGVKLNLADGPDAEPSAWLLFRASGTEPVLRLYCEAPDEATVAALLGAAREFVAAS